MVPIKEALTFDDVTLAPKYSDILPSEVNTSTQLTPNLKLKIPLLSSAMDTVTESKMAIAIAKSGGIGVIHRNLDIKNQILEIKKVKKQKLLVGAAVGAGPNEFKRAEAIVKEGVDLIVVDSGVEENHPEFAVNADGTGGSRVVNFDWSTLNVPGCPTGPSIGGYLGDSDGHGTNCASIAAGNTQGWASGATIYSLRIFQGTDITDGSALGGISTNIVWDIIKAFHDKKVSENNTRPTICTNSWGFRTSYTNITSITYRGTTTPASSRDTSKGMINFQHGVLINSQSVSVANASSTGVIMVGAAGNYFHKSDVNGGLDYDNFYTSSTLGNVFYHRGSSPTNADEMICVGATASNDNFDTKVNFSETGPRVDIYAPGDGIMGGYANKSYNTAAVQDPRDPQYFLNKISGTSQATPQVAGVMCLLAQADPTITKTQMLDLLNKYALVDIMDTGVNDTDYTNVTGLQGGPNVFLQNPFSSPNRGGITST